MCSQTCLSESERSCRRFRVVPRGVDVGLFRPFLLFYSNVTIFALNYYSKNKRHANYVSNI